MPPRRKTEDELALVASLRGDPGSPATAKALTELFHKGSSFAVAAAATLVGDESLDELAPLLAPAFRRFVDDGVKRDPGCKAKIELVRTLGRLGRDEEDAYLTAVGLVQKEPAFGPPVDTAASLRAHAGAGLAAMGHPDAAMALARLLADPEPLTRAGAATGLSRVSIEVALPLLLHKVLVGDPAPEVLGDCFRTLLALAPGRTLDLVVAALEGKDLEVAEQAALALGESREPAALARLIAHAEAAMPRDRKLPLVAIALSRLDAGIDYLLAALKDGDPVTSQAARDALHVYKDDPRIAARVRAALAERR